MVLATWYGGKRKEGLAMNDQIAISLISAISGVVIAYIVNVAAKKAQAAKDKKQPKDRMEQMFDGYERLIRQKDAEDDRKQKYIKIIEEELRVTKLHVSNLEAALAATNEELKLSREDSLKFQQQLDEMRKEYKSKKREGEL